jgi:hypothetical protein
MTYVCLDKGLFLSRHVEKTQEISSLEYFTFVRLDCEKLRRSLGDVSRKLSNTLLKNVVDTYRQPVPSPHTFCTLCSSTIAPDD